MCDSFLAPRPTARSFCQSRSWLLYSHLGSSLPDTFFLARKGLEAESKPPAIALPLEGQASDECSWVGAAPQDVEQVEPTEPKDPFVAPIMAIITLPSAMVKTGTRQMDERPHR